MWFVGAPVSFEGDPTEVVPPSDAIAATRPADRHLTLVYLGPMPEEGVVRYWGTLPQLTLPERLRPRRWEQFGRRAIALSLVDDGLLRLTADACFDVAAEQLPEVRRPPHFRAHVTLGRIRKGSTPPTRAAMSSWSLPEGLVGVGPPTLFRTRGNTAGDRYEVVEQQPHATRPS